MPMDLRAIKGDKRVDSPVFNVDFFTLMIFFEDISGRVPQLSSR